MPQVRHRNQYYGSSPVNNGDINARISPHNQPKVSLSINTKCGSPDRPKTPVYTNLASPKLHGGSRAFERFKRTNKYKLVLGGSLIVLSFCMAGVWISSKNIQANNKARRHRTHVSNNSSGKNSRVRERTKSDRSKNRVMEVYRPLPSRRTINKVKPIKGVEEENHHEQHDTRVDAASEERRDYGDDDYNIPFLVPSSHVDSPSRDVDMRLFGYTSRPRVVHCKFKRYTHSETNEATLNSVNRLPTHESKQLESSDRYVTLYPDDDEHLVRQSDVKRNSKKYRVHEAEEYETDTCKSQYEWQKGAFPNCNNLHEFELGQLTSMHGRAMREALNFLEGDGDEQVRYWAHGYWRDVWLLSKTINNREEISVLKTLRKNHDFTDRNYDRHRKDALASERLSKSPYVVDIYAFCSNSALFEYGDGGDIDLRLWPYDKKEKKHYVADLSSSEMIDIGKSLAASLIEVLLYCKLKFVFSISSSSSSCRNS